MHEIIEAVAVWSRIFSRKNGMVYERATPSLSCYSSIEQSIGQLLIVIHPYTGILESVVHVYT